MTGLKTMWEVIKRELRRLTSRPLYVTGIVVVPVMCALFFVTMLDEGLPVKAPAAVVDLDHSPLSRKITRQLGSVETVDVTMKVESFNEAMAAVRRGDVMGFFVIPANFEKEAFNDNGPTLSFYSNLTYFVPGTLVFKGFKTMAVTTSAGIVQTGLTEKGAPSELAGTVIQPMTIQIHPLNNPYLSYAYYLATSFIPGVIELMVFLMTVWAVTHEIKSRTGADWLRTSKGDIWVALTGKLLPQTVIFTIVGFFCNALLFKYLHYPMNGSMSALMLGMFLLVVASQSFGVFISCLLPNMRLALSICSLTGILAFSIAAFSFPVQSMYGGIAIFSYILPVRYYFLIYIDQALNGIPVYYSREYFAALVCFIIPAVLAAPLLRKRMANPVYVP